MFASFFVFRCQTIENFCTHARNGYYDGVIFHRVIKGFMVQTVRFSPKQVFASEPVARGTRIFEYKSNSSQVASELVQAPGAYRSTFYSRKCWGFLYSTVLFFYSTCASNPTTSNVVQGHNVIEADREKSMAFHTSFNRRFPYYQCTCVLQKTSPSTAILAFDDGSTHIVYYGILKHV